MMPLKFSPTEVILTSVAELSVTFPEGIAYEVPYNPTLFIRESLHEVFWTLLSVVGLYGVLSYTVAQRSREIGMRMALGAERTAILGLVLRDGVPLVLLGVGIGVAGAFAFTKALASLLFGVSTRDPGVFVGAPLLLMVAATLAVLIPAIRATRVDPVKTLAAE